MTAGGRQLQRTREVGLITDKRTAPDGMVHSRSVGAERPALLECALDRDKAPNRKTKRVPSLDQLRDMLGLVASIVRDLNEGGMIEGNYSANLNSQFKW